MSSENSPDDVTAADDARWAAVVSSDAAADGEFFYAVKTTGVYCRPSCGARVPRRENVTFYETVQAAEAAGFRPCKRCRPDAPSSAVRDAETVASICRMIESAEKPPTLAQLADAAGVSESHLHRMFKRVTGVTPASYAGRVRAERASTALAGTGSVMDAAYKAGFNSSSRFYEKADEMLGMTPSEYRTGGEDVDVRFAVGESSLGAILVAASARGVCAVLLGDDPEELVLELQRRFPRANLLGGDSEFERTVATVVGFVEAPCTGLDLPLDIRGTAFQQRVWAALREIPPGETASYQDVARAIGSPNSTRAVAGACAANHIAVAIPCHRVVRTDGGLSGYRWGVDRKRELLDRERGCSDVPRVTR